MADLVSTQDDIRSLRESLRVCSRVYGSGVEYSLWFEEYTDDDPSLLERVIQSAYYFEINSLPLQRLKEKKIPANQVEAAITAAAATLDELEFQTQLRVRRVTTAASGESDAEPIPPYLDKDDVTILESLARRKGIVAYQADITEVNRDRASARLRYLASIGYVTNPPAKKRGWLLTEAGMQRLENLPAV